MTLAVNEPLSGDEDKHHEYTSFFDWNIGSRMNTMQLGSFDEESTQNVSKSINFKN